MVSQTKKETGERKRGENERVEGIKTQICEEGRKQFGQAMLRDEEREEWSEEDEKEYNATRTMEVVATKLSLTMVVVV